MSGGRCLAWVGLLSAILLAVPDRARADEPIVFTGWPSPEASRPPLRHTLYDAGTLERRVLGVGAGIGFPYLTLDVGYGIDDASDVRGGVKALYGVMSQVELSGRWRVHGDRSDFAVALKFALEYAVYRPGRAAMILSGTRDLALHPGVVLSARAFGDSVFFADLGLQLALEFDPPSQPLGGAPPPVGLAANLPLHLGMELPITKRFNFVTVLGLDVRFGNRSTTTGEPPVLPYLGIGLALAG